jgi:hypothetical protein
VLPFQPEALADLPLDPVSVVGPGDSPTGHRQPKPRMDKPVCDAQDYEAAVMRAKRPLEDPREVPAAVEPGRPRKGVLALFRYGLPLKR